MEYDNYPEIGKNRVMYEAFLKIEEIVTNLQLSVDKERERIRDLEKSVLQLFKERRLINCELQQAGRNQFRHASDIAPKGIVLLIVALIEALLGSNRDYRSILDSVQKYQRNYKKYPRAIFLFKDMKLLEWTENHHGKDLSFINSDQRFQMANYEQIRMVDCLLAPTVVFSNQSAELQQYDLQDKKNQLIECSMDKKGEHQLC